jgi:hypothetical protein
MKPLAQYFSGTDWWGPQTGNRGPKPRNKICIQTKFPETLI